MSADEDEGAEQCPNCGFKNTEENNPTAADGLGVRCKECGEVFNRPEEPEVDDAE